MKAIDVRYPTLINYSDTFPLQGISANTNKS